MQENLNQHYLNIKRKFFGAPKTPIVRLPKDPALQSKAQSPQPQPTFTPPPPTPVEDARLLQGCTTLSARRKQMVLPILREANHTWEEVMSKSQKHCYLKVRTQIYILLREDGVSLTEIGRMCGGKDHTTVLHSIRKFKGEI